jgi:hypothetical protein
MAQGELAISQLVPRVLEDATQPLPDLLRELIAELLGEWDQLGERVNVLTGRLETAAKADETAKRLMTVRGVGPIIATALLAKQTEPERFANARLFAAYFGLVPSQHSSAEKPVGQDEQAWRCLFAQPDDPGRPRRFKTATTRFTAAGRPTSPALAKPSGSQGGGGAIGQPQPAHPLGATAKRPDLSSAAGHCPGGGDESLITAFCHRGVKPLQPMLKNIDPRSDRRGLMPKLLLALEAFL